MRCTGGPKMEGQALRDRNNPVSFQLIMMEIDRDMRNPVAI